MLERINAVRMEHGLPPLAESAALAQAARGQAVDLSRNQWLIDSGRWHEGSDGSSIEARLLRALMEAGRIDMMRGLAAAVGALVEGYDDGGA